MRIGRRWLIPAEAVDRLAAEGISPAAVEDETHRTLHFVRGPAPDYAYFERPIDQAEAVRFAATILEALRIGGWPYDTFQLRPEGIGKMILGQETAPVWFWRYLSDGIAALQTKRGSEHIT